MKNKGYMSFLRRKTNKTHNSFDTIIDQPFVSFDLEWAMEKDEYNEYTILAAGFFDNGGVEYTLLLEDYKRKSEKSLLYEITKILSNYDYSMGFYSTGARVFNPIKHKMMGRDSDLINLHKRLIRFGIKSPIFINEKNNRPYLVGANHDHCHIDAFNLFSNKIIKASIYNNAYNSYDLDTISRVILGPDKGGKYEGLTGPIFETLIDLDEKRNYVGKDARLLFECVAHNDWELLKVIDAMATLVGVPFNKLCNFKGATQIWTPILDSSVDKELNFIASQNDELAEPRYNTLYNYMYDKRALLDEESIPGDETEIEESLPNKNKRNTRYIGGWVKTDVKPGQVQKCDRI